MRSMWCLAALLALPNMAHAGIERIAGGEPCAGLAAHCNVQASSLAAVGSLLYVAAYSDNVAQAILPDGGLATVAGTTMVAQSGQPPTGLALTTPLTPFGIAAAANGDVFLTVGNTIQRVRGAALAPIVQTAPLPSVSLQGPRGLATSATGLWVADSGSGRLLRYDVGCGGPFCQPTRTISGLGQPYDVQVSPDESVVVVLEKAGGGRVRRVNADGTTFVVAGGGSDFGSPVPALSASLGNANGLALAPDGRIYVADAAHNRVVRIADGLVTTVAGTGAAQVVTAWVDVAPGQPATVQPISAPTDVAVSEDGGVLYVASQLDRRIYAVSLGGAVPTLTATSSPVPTQTSAITSTPTLTATLAPTFTRTATRMPTCLPTATAQSQCVP